MVEVSTATKASLGWNFIAYVFNNGGLTYTYKANPEATVSRIDQKLILF